MTVFKLFCNQKELQLIGTLNGGQSFRWTHNKEIDEWIGVFSKTVWKLHQTESILQFEVIGSLLNSSETKKKDTSLKKTATSLKKNDTNLKKNAASLKNNVDVEEEVYKKLLQNYFRLDVDLGVLYKEWSAKDDLFNKAGQQFYGIRMLRQEPVENLFSFICSQNNHISRISGMVEKLCTYYGDKICEYNGQQYYSFPEVEKLVTPRVECELRELGFGYRAKFIQKAASQIVEAGGMKWFEQLAKMPYVDAKTELMKLHGIGPKVADCICLMSLNHLSALPVDTHVYQIAAQHYLPHLRGKKSVTDKMYKEIGDHFRNLYGDLAGWAHTILFCADLKKFQNTESESANIKANENGTKKRRKC